MGTDYALVHLWWNIPPAALLSFVYYPLSTKLDVYKTLFLITIAVTATIPWDSYLIRNNVWSYPDSAVLGPTLFAIPIEELFFFVIQTYNTSLLYCLLSKTTFHAVYLRGKRRDQSLLPLKWLGASILTGLIALGIVFLQRHGEGFYMGLILTWAGPFALLLWMLAYQFILELPWKDTVLPIALPTLYLWLVDTLALRRGTWVIEQGTKLNWQLWEGLEIEEAVFFLATNVMIVFGLVAFDNAMAILDTFTVEFPTVPALPSPAMMVRALLMPTHLYNEDRICGLQQALLRLNKKSRSFSIASCVFSGRVRTDLILLYSFCRIADDLVDEAASTTEARKTIVALRAYLDRAYAPRPDKLSSSSLRGHVTAAFPATAHQALFHLPTEHMPPEPLYELLDGFDMDLDFGDGKWPIQTESDLELYAKRVASTVAELCIHLVYKHHGLPDPRDDRTKGPAQVIEAGVGMGIALQLVNIARDIQADARMDRVYVPATWLKNHGMTPEDLIAAYKEKVVSPAVTVKIEAMRRDLLHWALRLYDETRPNIEHLPAEARGGVRVMVDSYVEIGHVLLLHGGKERDWGYRGRATVPAHRRLAVAWRGMAAP